MADDAADQELSGSTTEGGKPESMVAAPAADQPAASMRAMWAERGVLLAGLIGVAVLGTLVGWLGYRAYESHGAEAQRGLFLQVARQSAVNLTTFDYRHVDAEVQRILGMATGTFYDSFSHRSQSFVDIVKHAQSESVGTVTEAGVESQTGEDAQVLVAVSVKTANPGSAEQEPQTLQMRITMHKTGGGAKVSNVAFLS